MGHRITVVRALSGTFMTSLNMPGFSLSLVLLPTEKQTEPEQITIDADMLLELLDAPTSVPGWRNVSKTEPNVDVFQLEAKEDKRKPAADADVEAGPKRASTESSVPRPCPRVYCARGLSAGARTC